MRLRHRVICVRQERNGASPNKRIFQTRLFRLFKLVLYILIQKNNKKKEIIQSRDVFEAESMKLEAPKLWLMCGLILYFSMTRYARSVR